MIDIMKGVIERRILVNYRIDPYYLAKTLPEPFRPRLINGHALGGICLIRFKKMRPIGFPSFLGSSSENGTHRFCVEWDEGGKVRSGIYVKQRFTNSRLHEFGGDRFFPGNLNYSNFNVEEKNGYYSVSFKSKQGDFTNVEVRVAESFPQDSIFETIEIASKDFQKDKIGYSPDKRSKGFKGVKLNTSNWEVTPLTVIKSESSLFSNIELFPKGSFEIDHSLLMKNINHNWQNIETICGT